MNKFAFWGIFIVPILWGIGFPLTHNAVQMVNPGVFAFYRQTIAAACLLPFAIKFFREINKKIIISSFFIGLWSTLNMMSQSFALATISSAMTAFFVTLNILFVPILLLLFGLSKIKIADIAAVILGLISILVTFHGSLMNIHRGDLFGLLAAFAIAMNIITIKIVTKNADINRLLLTCLSMIFGVIFLLYFPLNHHSDLTSPKVWTAILYQGSISTALAYLLQIIFQKQVGETRTAIILNLDLVFASLFGLVNHELLSMSQIVGGAIAMMAAIFHDLISIIKTYYLRFTARLKAIVSL